LGKIYLTRHARRRMKWRNISMEEVEETLAHPEKVDRLLGGRINVLKPIGEKLIRVTFREVGNRVMVISVVDKNK